MLWVDAARWNVGPAMVAGCQRDGTLLLQAPGEAHHQMRLVESHGRLAERMLERVIDETSPTNDTEWEECLDVVNEVINQMLRLRGQVLPRTRVARALISWPRAQAYAEVRGAIRANILRTYIYIHIYI